MSTSIAEAVNIHKASLIISTVSDPEDALLLLKNIKKLNLPSQISYCFPIGDKLYVASVNKGVYIYYWYDKYNQPIEWIGKFENNQFKMKEENENNQEILIEANYIENKIIGNWKNKTTNKTLKLELIEY